MTTIYHNPRCSKSRAALELLQARDIAFDIVEYLKTPLTEVQIKELVQQANLPLRELLRTNEAIYAELQLDQADNPTLIAAVAAHPVLLNRPIVQTKKGVRLGRPLEALEEIL